MVDRVPIRDEARSLSTKPVGEPITHPDEAIPVVAWLSTRDGDVQVTGWATAWSPRAVHIRYHDRHGREGFAWVWANAASPTSTPLFDDPFQGTPAARLRRRARTSSTTRVGHRVARPPTSPPHLMTTYVSSGLTLYEDPRHCLRRTS